MAQKTVTALATELITEAGLPATSTTFLTQIELWVSEVYRDLVQRKDWFFLREKEATSMITVASQKEYSVTTATDRLVSAWVPAVNRQLVITSEENLLARGFDTNVTGTPRFIYPTGFDQTTEKYRYSLQPVPAGIETIQLVFDELGADIATSTPIPVPDNFLQIIKDGVRVYIYQHMGQVNDSMLFQAKYENGITNAISTQSEQGLCLQTSDIQITQPLGPTLDPSRFGY